MVCNAHIDPVWQWQWDEGLGVALSTFRTAADFCEEFDGFVFNHNESILYEWVKEYDPALFARIKRLVKEGKWKIIGGWYLQPDCNMPAGEAMIRQITAGRRFFEKEFGIFPETAVNFDPFGHCRGLVQILAKAGYCTYMVMRPDKGSGMLEELPQYFVWKGYGGTSVNAYRLESGYSSQDGNAAQALRSYMEEHSGEDLLLKTWGIGDHGGGPSRYEWGELNKLFAEYAGQAEFIHSDPDSYFALCKTPQAEWEKGLNPMFIGAYTSMSELKKAYRELENALFFTEKLASAASCQGLMEYPAKDFERAERSLLYLAFHDTIGGTLSRIPAKESMQEAGYALEILSRIRTRAFYAIASREEQAQKDSLPIFVYNPHPYPVKGIWECGYGLADYSWENCTFSPVMYQKGVPVACQAEKEDGNVPIEFRKRVVFEAELAPMAMERFDLFLEKAPVRAYTKQAVTEEFVFRNQQMEVVIDPQTGRINSYCVEGRQIADSDFGRFTLYEDNADPWGMMIKRFGEETEEFRLMTPQEAAVFAGVRAREFAPVHIIEDGDVRTVVEAFFAGGRSEICVQYKLPKEGAYIDVDVLVYWNERDKVLRMNLPTAFLPEEYLGQTMFGADRLEANGNEQVCQRWAAAVSKQACLTVINNATYGLCCQDGLHVSLLRAPAHAAMPIPGREMIRQDRFTERIDQGAQRFSFRIEGGSKEARLEKIDTEAQIFGEKPYALNVFPTIRGEERYQPPLCVEGGRLDSMTPCGDGYLLRIFNPLEKEQTIRISSDLFAVQKEDVFLPYQFETYLLKQGMIVKTDIYGNCEE